jgi:epoxyqueuosine reductase
MPNSISDLKAALIARAQAEGFAVVRFARAEAPPQASARLGEFLAAGRHGEMAWLAANAEKRADPQALWPDAKTVMMLGMNYASGERGDAAISRYARGDDYHEHIKQRLKRLAADLIDSFGGEAKVFVDTAPVLEKALAEAAGIGWQGKHTNLVSRDFGSWLFLGSVFTTLDIPPDRAERNHCGRCHACLDACPTHAFVAPFRMDARRCISYLTIEHKGHIPRERRAAIGHRIYGCDTCLAACPWNKFAKASQEIAFAEREALRTMGLADYARLDDAAFRALFAKSPIKRIGRDRFVRNALIAIGNSGDARLATEPERLLDDASPLVRAATIWALKRLDAARIATLKASRAGRETDEAVREEWDA